MHGGQIAPWSEAVPRGQTGLRGHPENGPLPPVGLAVLSGYIGLIWVGYVVPT